MIEYRFVETQLRVIKSIRLPSPDEFPELMKDEGWFSRAAESCWVVAYDAADSVRTVKCVATGDFHGVELSLPVVLNTVVAAAADRFQLVHNHPSGMVLPSDTDMELNLAVMDAANTCGLLFEDNVIIAAPDQVFSFRENELLLPVRRRRRRAASEPFTLR